MKEIKLYQVWYILLEIKTHIYESYIIRNSRKYPTLKNDKINRLIEHWGKKQL
jgi:hypothetical protein